MVVAACDRSPVEHSADCPNIPNARFVSREKQFRDMDLRQVVRINGWPEMPADHGRGDGRALEGLMSADTVAVVAESSAIE